MLSAAHSLGGQPLCSFHSSPLPSSWPGAPPTGFLRWTPRLPSLLPSLACTSLLRLGAPFGAGGQGWLADQGGPFTAALLGTRQERVSKRSSEANPSELEGQLSQGTALGADGEGGHPLSPSPLFPHHEKGPTPASETLPRGWTSAMETCGRRPFHSEAPAERKTPQSPNWLKGAQEDRKARGTRCPGSDRGQIKKKREAIPHSGSTARRPPPHSPWAAGC